MSMMMRLAMSAELATAVLEQAFQVHVMPAGCTHLERIAVFLAAGFILSEVAAAGGAIAAFRKLNKRVPG